MAFEDWKVRLRMVLETATHQPEDWHELQESLREEVATLRGQGLPVPQDILDLEQALEDRLNISRK